MLFEQFSDTRSIVYRVTCRVFKKSRNCEVGTSGKNNVEKPRRNAARVTDEKQEACTRIVKPLRFATVNLGTEKKLLARYATDAFKNRRWNARTTDVKATANVYTRNVKILVWATANQFHLGAGWKEQFLARYGSSAFKNRGETQRWQRNTRKKERELDKTSPGLCGVVCCTTFRSLPRNCWKKRADSAGKTPTGGKTDRDWPRKSRATNPNRPKINCSGWLRP